MITDFQYLINSIQEYISRPKGLPRELVFAVLFELAHGSVNFCCNSIIGPGRASVVPEEDAAPIFVGTN